MTGPQIGRRGTLTRSRWLAPLTVVLASFATAVPLIATVPILPPFGLMMLMAWRLRRPDLFRSWSPLPLGALDDLVSGQPFGSAMMLWTFCFLALDMIEGRLVWRDFWQDWLIASGAIILCLAFGRLIATPLHASVDLPVLAQMGTSIALYPAVAAMCARLDPRPSRA